MRIGLLLNILDEEYQTSIYKGIKERVSELGIDLICLQQENSGFAKDSFTASFPKKNFFNLDGIILLTSVVEDNNKIKKAEDIRKIWGNLPVVSIGQKIEGIPSLLVNTEKSIQEMVDHLIKVHNYRNFLFISGTPNHHDAIIREEKFIQAMNEYKQKLPELNYKVMRGWFTERGAIMVMNLYYEQNPGKSPDVIFCANDNMAIGVYKFFKMNRDNPAIKQCAVTGFDDIPRCRFEIPSLTTIRQPLEEIGLEAVNTIVNLLNGKKVDDEIFLDSKLLIRESCGCNHGYGDGNSQDSKSFVEQMQANYIRSEQLLRMVGHIGQELNYGENESGLKQIVNSHMEQLGVENFCILNFIEHSSDGLKTFESPIQPVYVRRNGRFFYEFDGNRASSLGEFYNKYLNYDENHPKSLVLKFLYLGTDFIGCVLYDSLVDVLPYLSSISINIAQTLNRIIVSQELSRRSEYLEREVEKRTKELVEANNSRMQVEAEVLRITEIERQRFSNDLHDDICQRLAGISMLCRSYSNQEAPVQKDQMVELAQLISDTLQTTRQYAHNSYPVELESLGMDHSLSNLCNSFEKQSGIKCEYKWAVDDEVSFDKRTRLNIFRIIQEALHNVMKHSQAQKVIVSVEQSGRKVIVTIADDGCGIPKMDSQIIRGLGLNSMQYRANQIGATFEIRPNKPKGTCVKVTLAIKK